MQIIKKGASVLVKKRKKYINLVLKIQQQSKNKDHLLALRKNGKQGMPGGTDEETKGPSQGTGGKGHRNPTKIIPYLVEPFLVSA